MSAKPADTGADKVVVCKFVRKPHANELLHHIIVVDDDALLGRTFAGDFPFPFSDAHDNSMAFRAAEEGEQAREVPLSESGCGDVVEPPPPPPPPPGECPDPQDVVCPEPVFPPPPNPPEPPDVTVGGPGQPEPPAGGVTVTGGVPPQVTTGAGGGVLPDTGATAGPAWLLAAGLATALGAGLMLWSRRQPAVAVGRHRADRRLSWL